MSSIFKRYEAKYLITKAQSTALLETLSTHMISDQFGEYLVQNLYYDTENWDVIRTSIEKPIYKEKMRLRCYGTPAKESDLYLELKKKHKGIVYKRRIAFPGLRLSGKDVRDIVAEEPSQISQELGFYLKINPVFEKIYLSYKRRAFTGTTDKGLRITFDTDIRYRLHDLAFQKPDLGTSILLPGQTIMEIKTLGGMPLWLARTLSKHKIYQTSFSKYGSCYTDCIGKQGRELKHNA